MKRLGLVPLIAIIPLFLFVLTSEARMYSPQTGRFMEPDPIGQQGGVNIYVYTGDNPINRVDPNGLAYFAKRPLRGWPWIPVGSCNPIDDRYNTEISHEQLFFEDNKYPSNIGFFDDGTLKTEPAPVGYRCKSNHFNDCIMRKAVEKVKPLPYNLLGIPTGQKYNCQDWSDDVRREYYQLEQDPQIKKDCGECK